MSQVYSFNVRAHKYQDNSDSPTIRTWNFQAESEDEAYSKAWAERERINELAMNRERSRYIGMISLTTE